MDNKYGLGSRRLATEHQHQVHKQEPKQVAHHGLVCHACKSTHLRLCSTMQDHQCMDCGEWQMDLPTGYAIGRNSDY